MRVERIAGAGGITLAADVIGAPHAPAVVLLHGGGQTRYSWGRLARRLGQFGYYVLSLDLRGHGDSDWAPDGDYRLDAFVADLYAVLERLPSPPVLIGASLGGISALLAVGESERELARGLVLVDVVPRLEQEGVRRIRDFMTAHLDGFASLEEAAAAVAAYLPHRPRPPSVDGLRKNLRQRADGRFYWHWDPAFVIGERRPGAVSQLDRLLEAARRVRVPTLLVRGQASDVVSQAGVDELLALMPNARAVEVGGAGHMVAGDKNDAFNAAVEDFLRESFGIPELSVGA